MAEDAAGIQELPFPQIGRKAEPQGSRLQRAGALMGKRSAVESASDANLMLAQSVCQSLTVDGVTAQRENANLLLSLICEKLAVGIPQFFDGKTQKCLLVAEN